MEFVKVDIQVPKEGKEMIDAAAGIISHFVQKKPIAELIAKLPEVVKAVDGYDKIVGEAKGDGNDELAGYGVQRILAALKGE